jgi:hypothetical protein
MKYIFSIHSPITYFCAANVVLHEQLKKKDVIFLYTSFVPSNDLGLSVPSFYTLNKNIFNKLTTFNLAKAYDKYLNEIAKGEQFEAYIDLAHYYQKLLITHRNCTRFHFIEEGMASYVSPTKLEELTRIESSTSFRFRDNREKFRAILRVLRGYNLKLLALPYFANAFTFLEGSKYYGFSPAIYPGVLVENKVVLKAQSIHFSKQQKINNFKLTNALLLIEESYFKNRVIQEKELAYCLNTTMAILKKSISNKRVFLKLLPGQSEHASIYVKYLIMNQIEYQVLPNNIILEELLVESENCKVIGTVSSLLFYATVFGHEAFSNYALISEKPKLIFDELEFYWKVVKCISQLDNNKDI